VQTRGERPALTPAERKTIVGAVFSYPGPSTGDRPRFLATLEEDEIQLLLDYMQARRLESGERAVQAGESDRTLYMITAGSLEVLLPTPRGARRASVMHAGDIFGELAFFDGEPRAADVRALEQSEILALTIAGFDRLRLRHPQLALRLTLELGRALSSRLREMNRRVAASGLL
jgi:CRP/FNR family cyclic AMP-dependent transcriptional regulator